MSIEDDCFDDQTIFETKETQNDDKETSMQKLARLDGFRGFIESIVEEIILEEKPFDLYKEELKLQCEKEGVSYDNLEYDLEDFLENLDMGIKSPDGLAIAMAMANALKDAEKCYVREEKIEEITNFWNERHPYHEFHPHNYPPSYNRNYLEMLDYLSRNREPLLSDVEGKIEELVGNSMRALGFDSSHKYLNRLHFLIDRWNFGWFASSHVFLKELHFLIDEWENELNRFMRNYRDFIKRK